MIDDLVQRLDTSARAAAFRGFGRVARGIDGRLWGGREDAGHGLRSARPVSADFRGSEQRNRLRYC